jgi:hypothetical protein
VTPDASAFESSRTPASPSLDVFWAGQVMDGSS